MLTGYLLIPGAALIRSIVQRLTGNIVVVKNMAGNLTYFSIYGDFISWFSCFY